MKKHLILCSLLVLSAYMFHGCTSSEQPAKPVKELKQQVEQPVPQKEQSAQQVAQTASSGETLFNQHCKKCHRNGGNIINPEKTLYSDVLEANNIRTPEDIVKNMRNPGKGMPKFDEKKIPDKEAREIGEYILQAFK